MRGLDTRTSVTRPTSTLVFLRLQNMKLSSRNALSASPVYALSLLPKNQSCIIHHTRALKLERRGKFFTIDKISSEPKKVVLLVQLIVAMFLIKLWNCVSNILSVLCFGFNLNTCRSFYLHSFGCSVASKRTCQHYE